MIIIITTATTTIIITTDGTQHGSACNVNTHRGGAYAEPYR